MDFQSLWDQGKKQVEQSWAQAVQQGVPAIQSAAEKSAMDWLDKQHAATTKVLESNVNTMLNDPSPTNPIAKAYKDAAVSAGLKKYGLWIVVGVVVVGVGGFYMMKKR